MKLRLRKIHLLKFTQLLSLWVRYELSNVPAATAFPASWHPRSSRIHDLRTGRSEPLHYTCDFPTTMLPHAYKHLHILFPLSGVLLHPLLTSEKPTCPPTLSSQFLCAVKPFCWPPKLQSPDIPFPWLIQLSPSFCSAPRAPCTWFY